MYCRTMAGWSVAFCVREGRRQRVRARVGSKEEGPPTHLQPVDELVPAPCELAVLRERARAGVDEDGRAAGRDVVHRACEGLQFST